MFEDDDYQDSTPARDEPAIKIYNLLCSLIESITPNISDLTLRDGSGERFNAYIDQLVSITRDSTLNDFKLDIIQLRQSKPYVTGESYIRKLVAATNYLVKTNISISYYCYPPTPPRFSNSSSSPSTTVNNHLQAEQRSSQTTTVQIEFTQTIVTLSSTLTDLERQFPDENSKENKFAKRLKNALPLAKDSLGIVSEVLKIGNELNLNPQMILRLLGLS